MSRFTEKHPSDESYWRAVILFGRNVASYKFALGTALLDLGRQQREFVPLEELALPFARPLATHLSRVARQTTSRSSRYLDRVREFNDGESDETSLVSATVSLGFNNVIDAFHRVGQADIPVRFFHDERGGSGTRGIRLTEELQALAAGFQAANLAAEVDARWSLVERAWQMQISEQLVMVEHDLAQGRLVAVENGSRRVDVTSCRDALNGYQKGSCFYCFRPISVESGSPNLADVDHFFPHALRSFDGISNVNGVWNLVLACAECNRGPGGKFDAVPTLGLLDRLDTRNEFLIGSHHPLRETLMAQTGKTPRSRQQFLQSTYNAAVEHRVAQWAPLDPEDPLF